MHARTWRWIAIATAVAGGLGAAGCGDDGPAAPDAATIDGAVPDVMVDADPRPCGADLYFTGGYEDWDSTSQSFLGVFGATVTEVADPGNTATTAPNGRSVLCLPATGTSQVTYVQQDAPYLPARFTVDADAYRVPYTMKGLKTARIASQFTDLGAAYDDTTTLVLIEVRHAPDGAQLDDVTVAIEGAGAGFHRDVDNVFQAGATTAGGAYLLFPNVPPGDGDLTVTVTATGVTCHAPATIAAVAGELAVTTVACE
ncbi:MAG: hypothetical protein H6709_08255 [Kofleriaceae bacterium]|nr:hypothetical protein [Kofleriaceae bacterium]MCB9572069.1 hypothetical protein [Kofleriaceae bacterium]